MNDRRETANRMKKCVLPIPLTMALTLSAIAAAPPPLATGHAVASQPLVILQGDTPSESGVHGKGNVYAPDVCVVDGHWRMWYGGQGNDGHDRIHLAESRDGLTWEKRGVVLQDKDANHVNDPSVVHVGNEWWMYYTRAATDVLDEIALAVSRDGVVWEKRGIVLAWFYMAIPVGSAIGYAFAGLIQAHLNWRWAFYLVAPPGLLLAAICLCQRDPRHSGKHSGVGRARPASLSDYKQLLRIPALVANILAQTALTFSIGGLSAWAPTYLHEARGLPLRDADVTFAVIVAVAGLVSTLFGGWLSDKLRGRFPGAYFLVSGCGMLLGFPCTIAMLYCPFPAAWVFIFLAIFFLFMNTGPSNTAIANVTPPAMRATAYALNILVIHLLGDAMSPWLIGFIKDHGSWNLGFFVVSTVTLLAGIIWLCNMKALARDTAVVEALEAEEFLHARRG